MSVVETIRGLRKMSLTDGDGGAAATLPPSPRNAQSRSYSFAAVVAALGGLDGISKILMEYWHLNQFGICTLAAIPKDMVDFLIPDLEEALGRGFLEEHRAVDMAVRRVQLLIEENTTLPLTPVDKTRLAPLIRENEKHDWEHIRMMMGE